MCFDANLFWALRRSRPKELNSQVLSQRKVAYQKNFSRLVCGNMLRWNLWARKLTLLSNLHGNLLRSKEFEISLRRGNCKICYPDSTFSKRWVVECSFIVRKPRNKRIFRLQTFLTFQEGLTDRRLSEDSPHKNRRIWDCKSIEAGKVRKTQAGASYERVSFKFQRKSDLSLKIRNSVIVYSQSELFLKRTCNLRSLGGRDRRIIIPA